MTHKSISPAIRRRLLLGGALATFSASFIAATPVLADPTDPGITASGAQVVTSDQRQTSTVIVSKATDPSITVNGQPNSSSMTLSDNTVSAATRANDTTSSLAPDAKDLGITGPTSISAGYAGTTANAAALIATRQSSSDTAVIAKARNSQIAASLGDVDASSVTVTGNTQQAVALANDATGTLSLTGLATGSGAGVVSDQSADGTVGVKARMSGSADIATGNATGSDLELTDNLQRAIAYGSSATNSLSVDAVSTSAFTYASPAASVGDFAANPQVNAAYAVVADQRQIAPVTSSAKGGFAVSVGDTLDASTIANGGNSLIAATYGNQSANGLDLTAGAVSNNAYVGGAVANVTNAQQTGADSFKALADGGASIAVANNADDSSISASGNTTLAAVTGNRADGNSLTVTATSIAAGAGNSGYGGGGQGGGQGGGIANVVNLVPVGTAVADSNGGLSVSAPFSVVNAQQNQGLIAATVADSATTVAVGGGIYRSGVTVGDNTASASTTGNSGTNSLTLSADALATAADLNNVQLGKGVIAAQVGTSVAPAGASIAAAGDVSDSSLAVSGNSLTGSATESTATNTMAISGVTLTNASGHSNAEAGATDAGMGGAADYALANDQQIKGGYQLPVAVSSDVEGSFGIAAGQGVTGSSLSIANNSQASSALGNSATNSLTLTAISLGSGSALSPGTALSSTQSGQTDVTATSNMALGLPSSASGSSLTISGNTNAATARMNSAVNTLTVDAVSAGSMIGGDTQAQGPVGGSAEAIGDHVLANNQTSDGNVAASAMTTALASDTGAALNGSSYGVTGNQTTATAAGNGVSNSLTLTATSNLAAGAALTNLQQNYGGVSATATSTLGSSGGAVTTSQAAVTDNTTSASAQGNGASNAMTVSGSATLDCVPNLALITTGPLNSASGPAALSNVQMNAGAVNAAATGVTATLGAGGLGVTSSTLGVTGNSLTAAAYGNSATNSVTLASSGLLPNAAIANTQMNSGEVTAQVTNAAYSIAAGTANASRLALTGNVASAQAVGNYAVNAIVTAH